MRLYKINWNSSIINLFFLLFVFSCSSEQVGIEEKLSGTWLRSDGTYKIEITEVKEDGDLVTKYFNPDPINVGRAGWRIQNKEVQIYIELRDENYPGSIYQLNYNEESKTLRGTYYQAVARQTYEVTFKKTK